jgi:hypothetical protein
MYTIKPGLLVSVRTYLDGGVTYTRVNCGTKVEDGKSVTKWRTTRTIDNPKEHTRAVKARSRASNLVRSCCLRTPFGLVCLQAKEEKLQAAITQARTVCKEWNARAKHYQIDIRTFQGRIASDDRQAISAMAAELRSLARDMKRGVRNGDVKAIREAASTAKRMGAMLDSTELQGDIDSAVKSARKAARQLVKRVDKQGEEVEKVVASLVTAPIEQMRIAFIDVDDELNAEHEEIVPVDKQRFADLVEV